MNGFKYLLVCVNVTMVTVLTITMVTKLIKHGRVSPTKSFLALWFHQTLQHVYEFGTDVAFQFRFISI